MRTRGFSKRHIALLGNRNFMPAAPVGASVTLLAADARVTYTAKPWRGTQGNSIRVRYVVAGTSTPLTVAVSGTAAHEAPSGLDITVNVATDGAGAATSTATAVAAAVNASVAARSLVEATVPGTGATVVSAVGYTNLAGGTSP